MKLNLGHVFRQNFTMTFLFGSLVEVNIRISASQARFLQLRVIERLCVESNNNAVIVGYSSKDLQIIYSPCFQSVHIVIFGLGLYHFSLVTVRDGASQLD